MAKKSTQPNPDLIASLALEPAQRLSRDLALAAKTLSNAEARFLVNKFYHEQDQRIASHAQIREMTKTDTPHAVLDFFSQQHEIMEQQMQRALDKYTQNHEMGAWMREVFGIGPIISAGLLAHLDIHKAQTAGAFWRYAGVDPTVTWNKGEKRPWNAELKVIVWKATQSFVMFSKNEKCYYGFKVYRERKAKEWDKNLNGEYVDQALAKTEYCGKTTDAWKWYNGCYNPKQVYDLRVADNMTQATLAKIALPAGQGTPMLPPAHIEARACRFTGKVFLFDIFDAWWRKAGKGEPPIPYFIAHLDHVHVMRPPNYTGPVLFDMTIR